MSSPEPSTSRRAPFPGAGVSVLIFGLFFLSTWLVIGPGVIYEYQSPVFLTTLDFLDRFLDKPGGPVDYVATFLAQFCFFPWVGALIITAVAWGICLLTGAFLRAVAGARVPPWLTYFPAIPLLMLHSQYDYRLSPSVALLAGLLFVVLYTRIGWGAPRRFAAFVVLSGLLYYLAGGICVLFAVLCAIHELAGKRQIALGVIYLLCAPAIPLGFAMCSYTTGVSDAFVNLYGTRVQLHGAVGMPLDVPASQQKLLFVLSRMHAGLLLFFPLAAACALLGCERNFQPATSNLQVEGPRRGLRAFTCKLKVASCKFCRGQLDWTLLSATLFLLLGALLTWLSFDVNVKRRIEVEEYGERGDWARVLETARRVRGDSYDPYVMHEVNRALCHTGRLAYDMCSYPQVIHPPSVMLSEQEMTNLAYTKFAEWNLELGNVNVAQHWGHLALEVGGFSPRLLKLLVKVNVLQGRPEAAKTLLGELGKNLLYRDWADRYRRAIETDPAMRNDNELERLRPFLLKEDRGYGGFGGIMYTEMLLLPLRSNPKNKMAFEYLVAFYLLSRSLDKACETIGRMNDFDYPDIPRVYEEALVLYAVMEPGRRIDPGGRTLSEETVRRLDRFTTDLGIYQNGSDAERKAAYEKLVRDFGGSYFFFWQFGYTEPQPGWKMKEPTERGAPK